MFRVWALAGFIIGTLTACNTVAVQYGDTKRVEADDPVPVGPSSYFYYQLMEPYYLTEFDVSANEQYIRVFLAEDNLSGDEFILISVTTGQGYEGEPYYKIAVRRPGSSNETRLGVYSRSVDFFNGALSKAEYEIIEEGFNAAIERGQDTDDFICSHCMTIRIDGLVSGPYQSVQNEPGSSDFSENTNFALSLLGLATMKFPELESTFVDFKLARENAILDGEETRKLLEEFPK